MKKTIENESFYNRLPRNLQELADQAREVSDEIDRVMTQKKIDDDQHIAHLDYLHDTLYELEKPVIKFMMTL